MALGPSSVRSSHLPLVLATTADLGGLNGASLHLVGLASALSRRGHKITILAPRSAGGEPSGTDAMITWERTPSLRGLGLPGVAASPLMLPALRRLAVNKRLYVRSGIGTVGLVRMARAAGFSNIAVECNGWFADDLGVLGKHCAAQPLAQWLQVAEANAADHVRVVTRKLGELFVAQGVDAAKVHHIENGCDLDLFHPLERDVCRASLGVRRDATVLAFVGNLWPAIDLPVVFEAARRLADTIPRLELLIVGDGVSRADFEAASKEAVAAGVGVRWFGALPPAVANQVIGGADLAVAPFVVARNARIGLSPLKVRDYAAAGRPVIATDLDGIRDLEAQPWLHLAAAENPASYVAAIRLALASDRPASERAARTYADAYFGWPAVAERVSAMFVDS